MTTNEQKMTAFAARWNAMGEDRAQALDAMREFPAPGQRDCPECGHRIREEIERQTSPDFVIVTLYRCSRCGECYSEVELKTSRIQHYHDCVWCNAEYACNAPACRDGRYSDNHGC